MNTKWSKLAIGLSRTAALVAGAVVGRGLTPTPVQSARLRAGIMDDVGTQLPDHIVRVTMPTNKYMFGQSLVVEGSHLLRSDGELRLSSLAPEGGPPVWFVVLGHNGAPVTAFSISVSELLKLEELRVGVVDNDPDRGILGLTPEVEVHYHDDTTRGPAR